MTKRAPKTHETTVAEALTDAASIVSTLQEEMTDWRDNMAGANMDHLPKYEQVEQAADALENSDIEMRSEALWRALEALKGDSEIDPFPGATELATETFSVVLCTKKRPSRADRLGDAMCQIEAALGLIDTSIETHEASDEHDKLSDLVAARDEMRETLDELQGVEFPGMFG